MDEGRGKGKGRADVETLKVESVELSKEGWGVGQRGWEVFYLFEVRQHIGLIRLGCKNIIAPVTDIGFGVELLLLIERQGKECCSGFEHVFLKGAPNAVAGDLEENGGNAGGMHVCDDFLGFLRIGISKEGGDVDRKDLKRCGADGRCECAGHIEFNCARRFVDQAHISSVAGS